jgi:DMSO/TMAO reductase YedYZ molybdopterin-dependent catalytic subunit
MQEDITRDDDLPTASRRSFLKAGIGLGAAGLLASRYATAETPNTVTLPFANGERPLLPAGTFPGKGEMILQRTRAPLLETPWPVFQQHLFTPNDQAYVRWHMNDFPTAVDVSTFKLRIFGEVENPYELSLGELVHEFPPAHLAAINQCSGNSRGFISPRVSGAQWANGAMFNALWTGVPLSKLLARAGLKPDATHVAFRSLETRVPPYPPADQFEKVLPLARANDGAVTVAYEMNDDTMPLLNGFPLRLVVPGWYATYWVKMLSEIEVMNHPGEGFWMTTAYKIPDTPTGSMTPGEAGIKMVPISAMVPRSFITAPDQGQSVTSGKPLTVKGFAFGGNSALKSVNVSTDGGVTWHDAKLGKNWGEYGAREWQTRFTPATPGTYRIMVKATNMAGQEQPMQGGWNPGGFMYNAIEHLDIQAS